MVDLYTISVIAFFAILAILIYRDRKNIQFKYIYIMKKTTKGIKYLDAIAKYRKFWKIVGTIGVIVAFYLMITGIFALLDYGKRLIEKETSVPGLSFIFPSLSSQISAGPGYILIPFWFWMIIIASVIFPHEIMHGILSRVENVKVKSAGLFLFAIFPGAFVEPDEKQLKKVSLIKKLRIFAGGSFANFLVYLLMLNVISNLLWNYYVPGPIVLEEVNKTGPAGVVGLEKGMMMTQINGKEIKTTYSEFIASQGYLVDEASDIKPGDKVEVIANNTKFFVVAEKNPNDSSKAFFDIRYKPLVNGDENLILNGLFQLITWMWILNFAIAIVNISPIYPLDGGLMVEAIAEKINKKYAKKVTLLITFIMISIFFVNFATPFLIPLFG